MQNQEKIKELIEQREKSKLGGGLKRIEARHAKGEFTARERIDVFLDWYSIEFFTLDYQ